MLSIRRKGRYYYCRGTIRVGKKVRYVTEHATGCRERSLAETYKAKLEHEVQQELLHGAAGRKTQLTFAQAGQIYIDRPGGLHPTDIWRIGELNEVLGSYALADIAEGWAVFKQARCQGLAPATVERFRATLQAALNHACNEWRLEAPRLSKIRFKNERVRWLTIPHRERLLGSYVPHVRPIAELYAFQGCRTQEGLQLEWPNIDLYSGTIFFERTKSGEPRTVKMHSRVQASIIQLWRTRGQPTEGHVFLNRLGDPYADTRDYKLPGGNPLRSAHRTALKRAAVRPNGGQDFTVHDWRHHWASWCVMSGIDLETIKRMGGWKTLRMVERYTAVSTEHMAAAVAKIR